MENSQVPSSSQIICTQNKTKPEKKKKPFNRDSSWGVKPRLQPKHRFFSDSWHLFHVDQEVCAQPQPMMASVCHWDQYWVRPEPAFGLKRVPGPDSLTSTRPGPGNSVWERTGAAWEGWGRRVCAGLDSRTTDRWTEVESGEGEKEGERYWLSRSPYI